MEKPVNSVWIAGAGYLGLPLAQQLQAAGVDVRASSLSPRSIDAWHEWDFTAETAPQGFQQAACWVVLLPPSSGMGYVAHMQRLCEQAQQLQVSQLIYTSSTSVYGSAARECDEHSEIAPESAAARDIAACEQIWLSSGLPHVSVLRLGGLYDDERHPVRRLSGRQHISGGKHPVNVIHRRHALAALQYCIQHPIHGTFNVVEASHPSRADFYGNEAKRLGLALPEFDANDDSMGKTIHSSHQHWQF
ncbi:SDR family NAD(P)-dependent oxidoreductase [Vitreoscilla massiliensis]|uniref:SDR family NAD(P)-dependent oxidoreductase n=1 Tax=Vitreoscilla massiliensis TaxID=1689272 RepID=A0ABY4E0D7_9NEIS|nr:hypothetical protein [Vitreoscilla massiliensis]UOO88260.1 SDR family NAD(P)-dependent oxidoreductase [Vitreoscilla massiliensis]